MTEKLVVYHLSVEKQVRVFALEGVSRGIYIIFLAYKLAVYHLSVEKQEGILFSAGLIHFPFNNTLFPSITQHAFSSHLLQSFYRNFQTYFSLSEKTKILH